MSSSRLTLLMRSTIELQRTSFAFDKFVRCFQKLEHIQRLLFPSRISILVGIFCKNRQLNRDFPFFSEHRLCIVEEARTLMIIFPSVFPLSIEISHSTQWPLCIFQDYRRRFPNFSMFWSSLTLPSNSILC